MSPCNSKDSGTVFNSFKSLVVSSYCEFEPVTGMWESASHSNCTLLYHNATRYQRNPIMQYLIFFYTASSLQTTLESGQTFMYPTHVSSSLSLPESLSCSWVINHWSTVSSMDDDITTKYRTGRLWKLTNKHLWLSWNYSSDLSFTNNQIL